MLELSAFSPFGPPPARVLMSYCASKNCGAAMDKCKSGQNLRRKNHRSEIGGAHDYRTSWLESRSRRTIVLLLMLPGPVNQQHEPRPHTLFPHLIVCTPDGEFLRRIGGTVRAQCDRAGLRSTFFRMGEIPDRHPLNGEARRPMVHQMDSQSNLFLLAKIRFLHHRIGARNLRSIAGGRKLAQHERGPRPAATIWKP